MPTALGVLVLAVAVAAGLTRAFSRPQSRLFILDPPNHRSLHGRPTPRSGGAAIVGAIAAGWTAATLLLGPLPLLGWVAAGAAVVAGVGFVDDRWGVAFYTRLPIHMAGASLLLPAGLLVGAIVVPGHALRLPLLIATVVTLLYVGWMINLYNFMDGIDGIAGGMALIGFGALACLGWQAGDVRYAVASGVVACAAAGFLLFNFPPARIFMGDGGSSALGYLAAAMALLGVQREIFPLWVAVLVFSPFVVDATVTLVRRTAQGHRPWEAHRDHCYQRLVRSGWSHRRTSLWCYALMTACAGTALAAVRLDARGQGALLLAWVAVYVALLALMPAHDPPPPRGARTLSLSRRAVRERGAEDATADALN
jgi:UDP-N-acetylmuramyl pentapeptide phosphotransferase/UDP-N-acetylglucosamine-1-phosphate transferase